MTINEKKQLSDYIKGLVRESLNEMPLPDGFFQGREDLPDDLEGSEEDEMDDEDEKLFNDEDEYPYEDEDDSGIMARLHYMMESMARDAVTEILMEKKGGKGWKNKKSKDNKRKSKKEKTSSKDKASIDFLKSDGVNAAAYAYKLYGAKTEKEKASARSKLYKKRDGKKNDTGVPYKFNSKEAARLINLSKNKEL